MDSVGQGEEVGCWKKEKVLGSGGFGYVVLWRNKETNETIAMKQCRWGHDACMTPKHRSRWKLEVDIMSRLTHPNVVKAIVVPPELDVPASELPLLAMEYCNSGDLRKMLNKPENCCGLKEKQVRLLLRHISSAVNYLHSMRIIHRDLKPENIVIQDINGKVNYKLIDLGYAKELDQGSLCTSFVGTLQYLAPELFMTQKYSCTVDYWSLGLVTHEVMTGQRPFLPDKTPAEWIPIVKQKDSTHIRAYIDSSKNVVFSSHIAPTNSICSIFKRDVEDWLQLMLEWDPKKRGKGGKMATFPFLEKILEKKVVLVFCVETCQMLSFEVTEDISVQQLQKYLEQETCIPADEQELLLPKGICLSSDSKPSHFCADMEEDELIVFLFSKNPQVSTPSANITIPPSVETMMRNPREPVKYAEQREAWMQAVYLSQQESVLFNRLVQAFRTSLMHLLTKTSVMHKTMVKMINEMSKLVAKSSFFKKSLEQDLCSYEAQCKTGGISSKLMHEHWKASLENLKIIDNLHMQVGSLESSSANMSAKTIDLQRSPYARSKQSDPLEDIYLKVLDAYGQLKKRPKEQRHIPHDNTEMVRLMCLCLQHRETQIRDIFSYIRKVSEIKKETEDLGPHLQVMLQQIAEWDRQVDIWQEKRQDDVWKLIESVTKRIQLVQRAPSPSLRTSPGPASDVPSDFASSQLTRNSNYPWNPLPHYGNMSLPNNSAYTSSVQNGHYGQPASAHGYFPHFPHCEPKSIAVMSPISSTQSDLRRHSSSSSFSPKYSLHQSSFGEAFPPSMCVQRDSVFSSNQAFLSTLLEKSTEENKRTVQESELLAQRFHAMWDSMKKEENSTISLEDFNSVLSDEKKPG